MKIHAHAGYWLVSVDDVTLYRSPVHGYWGLRAALWFACARVGKADAFRWLDEDADHNSPEDRAGFVTSIKTLLGQAQKETLHV